MITLTPNTQTSSLYASAERITSGKGLCHGTKITVKYARSDNVLCTEDMMKGIIEFKECVRTV